MDENIKSSLRARGTWLRLAYMILFAIIIYVTGIVTTVVVVLQFLSKLFTGGVNAQLQGFGQSLGSYLSEIVCFLTFQTEDMPYPFAHWPSGAPGAPGASGAVAPPAKTRRRRRAKSGDEAKPETG